MYLPESHWIIRSTDLLIHLETVLNALTCVLCTWPLVYLHNKNLVFGPMFKKGMKAASAQPLITDGDRLPNIVL